MGERAGETGMLGRRFFNKETIIESVGIVTLFTALERVIQVGRGIIFARLLGPSEYGAYTLAFFFIPLAVTFAKLGIPSCFSRYIPQYEKKKELKDFLRKTYFFIIVASAFIALMCFINAHRVSGAIYGSSVYYRIIVMSSLIMLPYAIFEALMASFEGLRVFMASSLLNFSQFFIFTALGIILVIYNPKAESAILAHLITCIIVAALFSFIFLRHLADLDSQNSKIEESGFYKKIFKFSVWFIFTPAVYSLFMYTDRWMLTRLLGLSYAGIYSVGINFSGLIFTFGMMMGNILTPNLSESWEHGNKEKAIRVLNFATKINTLVLLSGAMALFLFRVPIVSILYGKEYMGCIPVINILLIFWLFNSILWTIGSYAHLIEKTYIRFVCSFVGLISNVALNYILIPKYGLMGAALATSASLAILVIVMFFWLQREGLRVKRSTIFVCTFPLILVFGSVPIACLFFILSAGLIWKTDFIIDRDEKAMLGTWIKTLILKYKTGRA